MRFGDTLSNARRRLQDRFLNAAFVSALQEDSLEANFSTAPRHRGLLLLLVLSATLAALPTPGTVCVADELMIPSQEESTASNEQVVAEGTLPSAQPAFTAQTLTDEPASIGGLSGETPENGFWFLNTHSSPQHFRRSGPVFRPGVSRYRSGGGYRRSSYSELLASIEPGVPVCIMVHGSFVDTESAGRESCYTWHWIRSAANGDRMQMIYFHWPSYRMLSPLIQFDTNQLGKQASRNGFYLAQLISDLPPECPVSILGHSHGSRVASSALHLMAGGVVQGYRHSRAGMFQRPIRTVFLAGAIDHHWLNPGEKYGLALCSTQGILNLKNCKDPALAIYPLRMPLITRRPIGNLGMTNRDRRRTGLASEKVIDFEVNAEIGRSHLWPAFYNSRRIAMTMRNYVYFPDFQPTIPGQTFEHSQADTAAIVR